MIDKYVKDKIYEYIWISKKNELNKDYKSRIKNNGVNIYEKIYENHYITTFKDYNYRYLLYNDDIFMKLNQQKIINNKNMIVGRLPENY